MYPKALGSTFSSKSCTVTEGKTPHNMANTKLKVHAQHERDRKDWAHGIKSVTAQQNMIDKL